MRAARAVLPVALLAAFLAGCNNQSNNGTGGTGTGGSTTSAAPTPNGVADLEPKAILDKAKAALLAAKTFRVKGDINSDNQKIGLDLSAKAGDASGTLTLNGAQLQIRKVGTDVYLKGTPELWKTFDAKNGETIAALLGDKWAKASTTTAGVGALANFADPAQMADLLKAEGTVTKGETKTINGVEAIGLKDSTGEGTLYIATVGEPYPVRIEGPASEGSIDFTDFNKDVTIEAPAAAEVVDLTKLMSGG